MLNIARGRQFMAILLLVALPICAAGQDGFAKSRAVDQAVLAEMERQQLVGASVGIILNSKVVYTKGYGSANLFRRVPVTSDTVFNWASNSKPVMAIAAMQLVQNGQLDLDKPISTYKLSLPDHLQSITARQLLCHQSGIPHYTNGKIVPSGIRVRPADETDPLESLHRFIRSPLIFEPGTKFEYSSYAYVLLSAVVQAAGEKPIEQQLTTRIIKPLGLASFQLDLPFKRQRDWTTAYKIKMGIPEEIPDYAHFWKHGAGAYKSNIKDFARFAAALANMELINAKTTSAMWTPQTTANREASPFGLGLIVSGKGPRLKISHSGSQDETRTRMVLYPNQKNGVVVMCNTQGCDPGRISTAIYSVIYNK